MNPWLLKLIKIENSKEKFKNTEQKWRKLFHQQEENIKIKEKIAEKYLINLSNKFIIQPKSHQKMVNPQPSSPKIKKKMKSKKKLNKKKSTKDYLNRLSIDLGIIEKEMLMKYPNILERS